MATVTFISNQQGADSDLATASVVGATERWQPGHLPEHSHRRHQLMYSVQGAIHVGTPMGNWMLPPSRAVWIRSGIAHSFTAKRSVELHVLYIEPTLMLVPAWQDCAVVNVTPLVRELITASVEFPWDYLEGTASDRLARVLLEQLVQLPKAPVNLRDPVDPRARRVTARLRAKLSTRETLKELAEVAAASPRTLERIFQTETGMSFNEWRHRLRLIEALEMLSEGHAVNRVASSVGYDHPSSFISAFRALFGTTPGNYFK